MKILIMEKKNLKTFDRFLLGLNWFLPKLLIGIFVTIIVVLIIYPINSVWSETINYWILEWGLLPTLVIGAFFNLLFTKRIEELVGSAN